MISFQNERGKRAFFSYHDMFFLFDGPVGRNLCPKKYLTISKTVICVGASLNCEISRVIISRPSS